MSSSGIGGCGHPVVDQQRVDPRLGEQPPHVAGVVGAAPPALGAISSASSAHPNSSASRFQGEAGQQRALRRAREALVLRGRHLVPVRAEEVRDEAPSERHCSSSSPVSCDGSLPNGWKCRSSIGRSARGCV